MILDNKDTGERPAGKKGECFYCKCKIGSPHTHDCAIPKRTVVMKATISYVTEVPLGWNQEQIEFHRNESSWCSFNFIEELPDCFCGNSKFEFIREATEEDHNNLGYEEKK